MTGTVVRVKGLKRYFEPKTGKWYAYHRKSGRRLKAEFGTSEFFAELEAINSESKSLEAKPGTLGALIESYRASAGFQSLKTRTKADYQKVLDYLRPLALSPLAELTQGWVARLRDKTFERRKRKFANYVLTVLSILFEHGIEHELIASNPVSKVKRVRKPTDAPEANRPWMDYERDAVAAALPAHMALPVALMMYCGLDPQDALQLPRTAVSNGQLDTRRGKTGVPVWVPLPAPVIEALAAEPKHLTTTLTLCANSYGKPWTVSGFRASWRPIRQKLEEDGKVQPCLTLKGLRHTVATILREMGKDYATIAEMLGQKTEAMAKHYSRRADTSKKMAETVSDFDAEVNRRKTKTV
ncbi:tyrosine-type recombinase/integrase [Rhizobium ruizarguesonis]|uniref:tyrosine-type recombinase/integrase n=1 Tax=Rhizobium ruizarguesonis TaxID=2081791 RepID=UPI001030B923|nr:tyrosine-type recombinase/integrase [Rhizobium ruizarguesonis]TAZ76549.1 site-specific recombinase [Rhizobium ruizarguesonis]TBA03182.1 site-specific recombinase [Rhizobium ruizarguesonis]